MQVQGRVLPLFKIMIFSPWPGWTNGYSVGPCTQKTRVLFPARVPGLQVQFWPQSGAYGRQPINVSISLLKNPQARINK